MFNETHSITEQDLQNAYKIGRIDGKREGLQEAINTIENAKEAAKDRLRRMYMTSENKMTVDIKDIKKQELIRDTMQSLINVMRGRGFEHVRGLRLKG